MTDQGGRTDGRLKDERTEGAPKERSSGLLTLPTWLREKLIKIGAKVVRHAKYVTFQMAEVAVPRELFAAILERIRRFGVPPPLVQHE